jgi:hypothetical protein
MQNQDTKQILKLAKAAYKRLDEEQLDILDKKEMDANHTAQAWIDILDDLTDFDYVADSFTSKVKDPRGSLGVYTFLYYFLGIFALSFLLSIFPLHPIIIMMLIVLPIIPWIFVLSSPSVKLRKKDLPNVLRLFVLPFITVLKEETEDTTPVRLKVNLKAVDKAKYPTENPLLKQKATAGNSKFFEYDVLDLTTRLADGSILHCAIGLVIRQRERYKRKGNKYKLKVQMVYHISLAMPKKDYTLTENPASFQKSGLVKYTDKGKRHLFKIKASKIVYLTETAYKGNYYSEYRHLAGVINHKELPDLRFILELICSIYKKVKNDGVIQE